VVTEFLRQNRIVRIEHFLREAAMDDDRYDCPLVLDGQLNDFLKCVEVVFSAHDYTENGAAIVGVHALLPRQVQQFLTELTRRGYGFNSILVLFLVISGPGRTHQPPFTTLVGCNGDQIIFYRTRSGFDLCIYHSKDHPS
jgi:hypothetical protein